MTLDIAESIFWEYEVITAVYVAVVLHDGCVSAIVGQCADSRCDAHPVGEGGVKDLHEHFSYVVSNPVVKYRVEKVSPLSGGDAERCKGYVFSTIQHMC